MLADYWVNTPNLYQGQNEGKGGIRNAHSFIGYDRLFLMQIMGMWEGWESTLENNKLYTDRIRLDIIALMRQGKDIDF